MVPAPVRNCALGGDDEKVYFPIITRNSVFNTLP
jgi:hypothetical protein